MKDEKSPLCVPLGTMYDGSVLLISLNFSWAAVSPATMVAVSQIVGNWALASVTGAYE